MRLRLRSRKTEGTNLHSPMSLQSQVVCRSCYIPLAYPIGAATVRCPYCHALTPIPQIRINCTHCKTPLLLPMTTTLALCPCCTAVMGIRRDALPTPRPMRLPLSLTRRARAVIYVENPPQIINGRQVRSVAVGTRCLTEEELSAQQAADSQPPAPHDQP